MIYTVTLNPAIDYVVQLPGSLTPGAINRSLREDYQFGGKGINVSRVLQALGHDSTALGFIAGQTGTWLEAGVEAMGLTARFIRTEGMTRINVKVRGNEETEINGLGPQVTGTAINALFDQLDRLLPGDVLVLSGSIPGNLSDETYGMMLNRVRYRDITTVVDASGSLLIRALPCRPFLIKPNRRELEELFGTVLNTDEEILSCARELQERGARNVLVSLGGDGALLLDETGNVHRVHCPQGTVVNSVGAGDSMVAGFLAGWLETKDYGHALKLGTAAGSATAFSLGLAEKEMIDALMHTM